jgi:DNA-binding NtrC family response regulator
MVESDASRPAGEPQAGVVLVVDDEESVRSIAVRMLQRLGYQVASAPDGPGGLAYFQDHAPMIRCVLIDMTMPGMSGEALCQALWAFDPGVRLVMMSGHAEQEMLQLMGSIPLAGFLQKPFNLERLRAVMAQVIGPPG